MTHAPDTTISDIISAIGADTIQARCDVGGFSIRAAKRDGKFPASWFDAIESECNAIGIACPRDLFAFKRPQDALTQQDVTQ
jgi:hypothetical protein